MLMRRGIHAPISAFLLLLPLTAHGADLQTAGQQLMHFAASSLNEPSATGSVHFCIQCGGEQQNGDAESSDVIDMAATELDLSSGDRTRAREGHTSTSDFRCPDTSPVGGPLTRAGLINVVVSLGMVSAEKAHLACEALAKEDSARAHKQDEAAFRFSRPLSKGMAGPDVRELQRFLNGQGFVVSGEGDGSPGNESDVFGALTVEAVKRYQKTYAAEILDPEGLSSPSGIFGPSSVKKANRLLEERRQ